MSQKSACRIIFTLLFTLAASISNATDVFQSPSQMSECDWSLVANAINPEGYRLYSLDAIAEFEARGFFSQAFGDDDRPNDTTADRLENKNWGSLQDIDTTLAKLRERFPSFRMRDGVASHVRSDYYRTFHANIYVDEKTGYLVASRGRIAVLDAQPERYSVRSTAMKLRVRKYEGSPLTQNHSKIELKFRSPIAGKIDKPSVLFDDQDLAILLGETAPISEQVEKIRLKTKKLVDDQGKIANRNADQVDEILSVLPVMRELHRREGYVFEPIVHIAYLRHAYGIPMQEGEERFELQLTRDSDLFVMKPQIVPKLTRPEKSISSEIVGKAPPDIGVLEDKTPLSKTGINPITKKLDPVWQAKMDEKYPEIRAEREILSSLVKQSLQNPAYQINRGKRYHFGHDAFGTLANQIEAAKENFDDPLQ
jgi:hypothetical protein